MAIFDGDRDKLGEYVSHMADLMGLSEWRITHLEDDPASDDADAQIAPTYGQQSATIRFDTGWADHTPEKLRYIICHELVHLHVDRMDTVTQNLRDGIGMIVWNLFHGAFRDAEELAVDNIAWAWAKMLPLPTADPVEAGGEIEEAA